MLVIKRRVGEQIDVRGEVRITVLPREGELVRLGFEGPGEVWRTEIVEAKGGMPERKGERVEGKINSDLG